MKNERLNAEIEKSPQTIDGPRRKTVSTRDMKSKPKKK